MSTISQWHELITGLLIVPILLQLVQIADQIIFIRLLKRRNLLFHLPNNLIPLCDLLLLILLILSHLDEKLLLFIVFFLKLQKLLFKHQFHLAQLRDLGAGPLVALRVRAHRVDIRLHLLNLRLHNPILNLDLLKFFNNVSANSLSMCTIHALLAFMLFRGRCSMLLLFSFAKDCRFFDL